MDYAFLLTIAAYCAVALVLLVGAATGVKKLRDRAYWNQVESAYPPLDPDAPEPRWLREFREFCRIASHLTPQQQATLDRLHTSGNSNSLERLADRTWDFARHIHRLDAELNTDLELASLEHQAPGAWLAALAMLTRDAIDQDEFSLLTVPWLAAGLPLPGGDTCAAYTLLVERCTDDIDPSASWDGSTELTETEHLNWETCSGPEIAKAQKGASAQQVAENVAVTLAASAQPQLRLWRVKVWNGSISDMSVLRTTPPDGGMIVANVARLVEVGA